ncbi:MAG: hypothetical protein E6H97_05620 [Chloroflexi bacterium]|nr:MAG: hypothetical protein E6H97_05620 [Chloroflexota bacterium]
MQPTNRASKRGRKPQTVAAVLMAFISVASQMVALAAITGAVPMSSRNTPTAVMASALLGVIAPSPAPVAQSKLIERIEVPSGAAPCPNSGAGAACTHAAAAPQAGISAVPAGLDACPADGDKPLLAPGACSTEAAPAITAGGAPVRLQPVLPTVTLSADSSVLASGTTTLLVAKATPSVTGTPWAIEIFDVTNRNLVGACTQAAVCTVAYTGKAGRHSFAAYVMTPGQKLPSGGASSSSSLVDVRWLGVSIAASHPSIVPPGKPITFTASATENVAKIGYRIEMRDATSGQRLTFCSEGTTCSTALVEPNAGTHTIAASLVAQSPASHASTVSVNPTSAGVSGTWMGVELEASSTGGLSGGVVSLTATANADLSQTPWSIYIQNEAGQQIGQPCNASLCSATISVGANDHSRYRAVIARSVTAQAAPGPLGAVLHQVPVPAAKLETQATSQLVRPTRMLWGVDSCKSFTDDPNGGSGLLPQVASSLGTPDFWGRYLPNTDNCPGLSGAEIQAAHNRHMAILPIYNNYDCSNVSGNEAGSSYGLAATQWAWNDMLPRGTAIAIDIEPPGDACPGAAYVDKGFPHSRTARRDPPRLRTRPPRPVVRATRLCGSTSSAPARVPMSTPIRHIPCSRSGGPDPALPVARSSGAFLLSKGDALSSSVPWQKGGRNGTRRAEHS